MRTLLTLAGALALGACATKPPVVAARQAGALGGVTFRVSGAGSQLAPAEKLVADGVLKGGLRPAAAGEPADYLLEVAYADKPRRVGAFVPAADAAGRPAWLARSDRWWSLAKGAQVLSVRLTETGSGQPAYEAQASRPYRKAAGDLPSLVDAALQPIKVD